MGEPTSGWLAPELLRGAPATAAADVFAWACLVLFATGAGRRSVPAHPRCSPTTTDHPVGYPGRRTHPSPRPTARRPTPSVPPSTPPVAVASGARVLRVSPARARDGDVQFAVRRDGAGWPGVLKVELRNRGSSAYVVPSPELIDDAARAYGANAVLALLLDGEWKLPRTLQPGRRAGGPAGRDRHPDHRAPPRGRPVHPGARLQVR